MSKLAKNLLAIVSCALIFSLLATAPVKATEEDEKKLVTAMIIVYAQSTATIVKALNNYNLLTAEIILKGGECQSVTLTEQGDVTKLQICPFSFTCGGTLEGNQAAGFKLSDRKIGSTRHYSLEVNYFDGSIMKSTRTLLYIDEENDLVMNPDSLKERFDIANILEILADFD